jgi:hypothetical protein
MLSASWSHQVLAKRGATYGISLLQIVFAASRNASKHIKVPNIFWFWAERRQRKCCSSWLTSDCRSSWDRAVLLSNQTGWPDRNKIIHRHLDLANRMSGRLRAVRDTNPVVQTMTEACLQCAAGKLHLGDPVVRSWVSGYLHPYAL